MRDEGEARDRIERLRRDIAAARRVVVFTGAGVSTESGVPDFRSPGSPWPRLAPIDFQTYVASAAARAEAWRRKFAMDDLYAGARPGAAHRAVAAIEAAGALLLLATQNIDGLHAEAGVPAERTVELHGNGTYARCLSCGRRHELADVRRAFEAKGAAPDCECGGMIKSATISFGQALPEGAMRRAAAAAGSCDLFLALGSTLMVHPAARLPLIAARAGARLVIANREPTPLDEAAAYVVRGEMRDIFVEFAEGIHNEPAINL